MPAPLTTTPTTRLVLRVLATIIAGVVVLLVANTARGSQDSASGVDQQSLLTIPARSQPAPTPIATTAPVALPTATPEPTATAVPTPVPTATAAPTAVPATPVPVPATAVPAPQASDDEGSVSVANAGAVAVEPAATVTQAPEPTATLEAEPSPSPEPTAIAPEPTATTDVVEPTPEPTLEPTPTPTPIPLQTAAQLEAYVLGEINGVRANAGLGPVALDASISLISRDWSQQMALGGFFDHRPGDQLNVMLPAGWQKWGENIASAPDIFYAQSSLENSPGHYQNMVGDFTHVGIGVYTTGSQVWVTQNFAKY